ncbi:LuxR C-terminal-related transcriptional regulator [Actinoplanes sp. KI2]|uniref:LuxR C-terminal-related transcriptional regulator n=1 Tax=Actinoplanes sp. KI2 TaxID=2983315 RepID=UPI0021D5760C|nr:LuxR C-terminal-related transcriptional regulator [Actinoplanes sp. KI2]MCU7727613.1 LuxR C-terminal-related transcriptional regulator [Actinoplanes sp. KI2]
MAPTEGFRLADAVADVYGDLRLEPVLRRLLRHTAHLTGSAAGSVSLIDAAAGRYTKAAEFGALCRLGDRFPLDEGATGRAYGSRRPVVIPEYGQLRAGHLAGADPARRGPAAAVPIWWRGDVVAVSVTFAPRSGTFSARDVDDLETLTQTAAAAIVRTSRPGTSLATVLRRAGRVVTEAGVVRPVAPEVARVAANLVAEAGPSLRVGIVYRPEGVRVILQDETNGAAWAGRPPTIAGGEVSVENVRGWGVVLRADIPYAIPAGPAPFTAREADVLELLRQGLTYREIASRLALSPKTVEKHVGAIMRKTGAKNRTAAVMTALASGWISAGMGNSPHTAIGGPMA